MRIIGTLSNLLLKHHTHSQSLHLASVIQSSLREMIFLPSSNHTLKLSLKFSGLAQRAEKKGQFQTALVYHSYALQYHLKAYGNNQIADTIRDNIAQCRRKIEDQNYQTKANRHEFSELGKDNER